MIGSNAILSRVKDELILIWQDHYPQKQHQVLESLFDKLNEEAQQGLPFLGDLRLRFEIAPARHDDLYNKFKRGIFEF